MLPQMNPNTFGGFLRDADKENQANAFAKMQNQYYPKQQEESLRTSRNTNAFNEQNNPMLLQQQQYKTQNMPNEIAMLNQQRQIQNALSQQHYQQLNMTNPLAAEKMRMENANYNRIIDSEIRAREALSQNREMGGSGLGTGGKEELMFQNLVALDNPHLKTPEQKYEASNVLRRGGNELSDGTKLNPLSEAARQSLNRLVKGGTYAGAVVPLLKAEQAHAEERTIVEMSEKDLKPYATTYGGYSPQQIIDTFKSDDASQKRLGNFIASQAAQYEIAQIRNRIAGGEPGISATQELMGHSGQIIKKHFPRLSSTARAQASKRLDEYLSEGLKSRKSVGVDPSKLGEKENNSSNNDPLGIR